MTPKERCLLSGAVLTGDGGARGSRNCKSAPRNSPAHQYSLLQQWAPVMGSLKWSSYLGENVSHGFGVISHGLSI